MINEEKLDGVLLELGHDDFNRGTAYIREGVRLYDAGHRAMVKDLYPAIGRAHDTTGARAERCMRHAIGKAWARGDLAAQKRIFGYSIDPGTGVPTVGEYVARLARICHEN